MNLISQYGLESKVTIAAACAALAFIGAIVLGVI